MHTLTCCYIIKIMIYYFYNIKELSDDKEKVGNV